MRTIEIRRHSIRAKPGQHLTQAGVALARQVGASIGPFDRVITSTVPRAFETAIAMGFAVNEQMEALSEIGRDVDDEIGWPAPFGEIGRAIKAGGAAAKFARGVVKLLREVARSLPEGGSALLVSHGGIVEAAAIGCLPDADHAAWGPHCGYCEGVRLQFDGEKFIAGEMLRVTPSGPPGVAEPAG